MADYRRNPYNRQGCCQQPETRPVQPTPIPQVLPACDQTNDSVPPFDRNRFPVAMLYVPWQDWCKTYDLERALKAGTIFPDLDKPFRGVRKGGCRK